MYLSYTYFIRNKITNQFYFGSRGANVWQCRTPAEDFWIYYFTSSPSIHKLRKEHGDDSFEFLIIYESVNYEDCYWTEQKFISENFTNSLSINKHYVDKASGNTMFSMAGKTHSAITKEKQSASAKGRKHNYDVWNKGLTKETSATLTKLAQTISDTKQKNPGSTWAGKKHSIESIQLMKNNWAAKIENGYESHWLGKSRPTKGGHWYNNGTISKILPSCPDGWSPGMIKRS